MARSNTAHLDALTGLRGLAAWYVVIFHTRAALVGTLPPWLIALAGKGYLAVDLFFILSGFVLWHTYGERLRGGGMAGAMRFWWRRFARIWPLHGAILSVFVALAALLALTGRDTSMYPWHELPLHGLLIQNWGFTSVLSWNDPAWSISCEMAAYLLFPAMALAPWARLGRAALLGLAAALLVAIWGLYRQAGADSLMVLVPQLGLWRCLLEFSLGNIVCLLWRGWSHGPALPWAVAGGALLGGLALGWPETAFMPLCFAALILALALDHGVVARLLASRALLYLGEISYSTYLAHFLLFVLFKLAFVHDTPHIGLSQLGAYLALVLASSMALYHGVEKPAQRWLNALPDRRHSALRPI